MENLKTAQNQIEKMSHINILKLGRELNARQRASLTSKEEWLRTAICLYLMDQSTLEERREAYSRAKKEMATTILKMSSRASNRISVAQ